MTARSRKVNELVATTAAPAKPTAARTASSPATTTAPWLIQRSKVILRIALAKARLGAVYVGPFRGSQVAINAALQAELRREAETMPAIPPHPNPAPVAGCFFKVFWREKVLARKRGRRWRNSGDGDAAAETRAGSARPGVLNAAWRQPRTLRTWPCEESERKEQSGLCAA